MLATVSIALRHQECQEASQSKHLHHLTERFEVKILLFFKLPEFAQFMGFPPLSGEQLVYGTVTVVLCLPGGKCQSLDSVFLGR